MRRRYLMFAVATAAALALAPAQARASNPVTYEATGTVAAGTPDITSVLVSDNTEGLITIQMNFSPGTEDYTKDSFGVYVDSDENPTTGDLGGAGADYLLLFDGTTNSVGLYKWDGSDYSGVGTSSLRGSFNGDTQYFVVAASELGITDGFNFNVAAGVGPDPSTSSQEDRAPADGTNWHYSMQSKAQISLHLSDWEDFYAYAGKTYSTALVVTRSDTNAVVLSGATIKCTITVGGRPDQLAYSGYTSLKWYKGGTRKAAVCEWRLPKNSAGKTLTAKESVTLGDSTISKAYTEHIKK
jgi:hypothetical protein